MNLILLHAADFISDGRVQLTDRRCKHIHQVHRASVGDSLAVGLVNQQMGKGVVESITQEQVTLKVQLRDAPPAATPITLILALPRPKMLKRILQACTSMGIKKIILLNSYRVEKSYWQTPLLSTENIQQQLILGLEQAKDTILPELILEKRFKPFVEDRLPSLCENTTALVAHPSSETPCPYGLPERPITLVIGPEGGFIPYEVDKLRQAGCLAVHLGERILRTETAVPVLLARLSDLSGKSSKTLP